MIRDSEIFRQKATDDPVLTSLEDIRVEVVTLRLVLRATLAYLALLKSGCAGQTLVEICGLLEGTGPYAVPAPDLDEPLRVAAMARARAEMTDLVVGIKKLPIS